MPRRPAHAAYGPVHAPPPRKTVDEVVLRLPVPPSVNDLHAHGGRGGPRRSPAYAGWIRSAGWRLVQQRPGRVEGAYAIGLAMPRSATKADLGNLEKAVSDLLQEHGVISNDRRAEDIHLTWQDADPEAIVTVRHWRPAAPVAAPTPSNAPMPDLAVPA